MPKELQQEVLDFMNFLLSKQAPKKKKKPKLNWIGGLKEYGRKYTSIELQEKAKEWRD